MSELALNASLCPSHRLLQDGSGCAYDKESLAIIKLNNTTVLYLKEVTKFLALVCILREESFERKGLFFFWKPGSRFKAAWVLVSGFVHETWKRLRAAEAAAAGMLTLTTH